MFNTLNVVETGLIGAKTAAQTAINNSANENTSGYIKRTTEISEAAITSRLTGSGLSIGDTIRSTNDFIYRNFIGESTSLAYYEELSPMLSSIEAIFKEVAATETTKGSGFSKDLDTYFISLANLKSNPQDPSLQEELKTNAFIMVEDMKVLYGFLEEEEVKLKSNLKEDVRDINEIVKNIANINQSIEKSSVPQLDLLDRRDALERELASMVDITVSNNHGDYELKIGTTTAVWNNSVKEFSYEESDTAQIDRFPISDIPLNPALANPDDKLVYDINGLFSVEVKYGDPIPGGGTVDETNILAALVDKINNDPNMSELVTASINDRGALEIVAKEAGKNGEFTSALKHFTDENPDNDLYEVELIDKNTLQSVEAKSESFISSYGEKVNISNGSVQAKIENLDTSSSKNMIQKAKDNLDTFARTLGDISKQYILNSDGTYVYGEKAVLNSGEAYNNSKDINLFSGSSVKTLQFNSEVVSTLEQKDYDYLVAVANKNNILFNTQGQPNINNNFEELTSDGLIGTSFSEFFQSFQIDISSFKANNNFAFDTQRIITQSLKSSFDLLVKVDPDEEAINIIKYQTAYEANAKLATILQDLIRTTLNMVNR